MRPRILTPGEWAAADDGALLRHDTAMRAEVEALKAENARLRARLDLLEASSTHALLTVFPRATS